MGVGEPGGSEIEPTTRAAPAYDRLPPPLEGDQRVSRSDGPILQQHFAGTLILPPLRYMRGLSPVPLRLPLHGAHGSADPSSGGAVPFSACRSGCPVLQRQQERQLAPVVLSAPCRAQCRGRCAGSVCCQMPTSAIQRITAPGTISLTSCAIRLGGRCWLRRHREHSGGYLGRFPDISGLECTEFSSVTRLSMRCVSDFGPKA